ncbi:hypothetical protein BCR43DRAFT_520639 [Syncephalastrum racemosum]|uniref:PH domain-containing protein n=1 Tax=Syncephalastrum racemosum TaxID=13706 RepID=A0A1X2HVA9_SYNRA|nr:hypothetical protein BCR43DRAFT_520639 [Syncephalastrum racemosum]
MSNIPTLKQSASSPTSGNSSGPALPTPTTSTSTSLSSNQRQELERRLREHEKLLESSNSGIGRNVLTRQISQLKERLRNLDDQEQQQQPKQSQQQNSQLPPHPTTSRSQQVSARQRLQATDDLPQTTLDKLRNLERDLNGYRPRMSSSTGTRGLESLPSPSTSTRQHHDLLPLPPPPSGSTPTKRRSKVPNADRRNTDIEFATEIGQGLLLEVRKMQALLQDKEEQLTQLAIQKSDLERAAEAMAKQLRQREETEEQLKEETWNLELAKQELTINVTELQQNLNKSNAEQTRLVKQMNALQTEIDQMRDREEKLSSTVENMKTRHEQDMASIRRHAAGLQREKNDQTKTIESLKSELAIAKAQSRIGSKRSHTDLGLSASTDGEHQGSDGDTQHNPSGTAATPLGSPPASSPKALEVETLKTSLAHAHRMVSNLRSHLHREKTEKFEFKKLLAESQEMIEQLQQDPRMWEDASRAGESTARRRKASANVVGKRRAGRKQRIGTRVLRNDSSSAEESATEDEEYLTSGDETSPETGGFTSLSSELSQSQTRPAPLSSELRELGKSVSTADMTTQTEDIASPALTSVALTGMSAEPIVVATEAISTQTDAVPAMRPALSSASLSSESAEPRLTLSEVVSTQTDTPDPSDKAVLSGAALAGLGAAAAATASVETQTNAPHHDAQQHALTSSMLTSMDIAPSSSAPPLQTETTGSRELSNVSLPGTAALPDTQSNSAQTKVDLSSVSLPGSSAAPSSDSLAHGAVDESRALSSASLKSNSAAPFAISRGEIASTQTEVLSTAQPTLTNELSGPSAADSRTYRSQETQCDLPTPNAPASVQRTARETQCDLLTPQMLEAARQEVVLGNNHLVGAEALAAGAVIEEGAKAADVAGVKYLEPPMNMGHDSAASFVDNVHKSVGGEERPVSIDGSAASEASSVHPSIPTVNVSEDISVNSKLSNGDCRHVMTTGTSPAVDGMSASIEKIYSKEEADAMVAAAIEEYRRQHEYPPPRPTSPAPSTLLNKAMQRNEENEKFGTAYVNPQSTIYSSISRRRPSETSSVSTTTTTTGQNGQTYAPGSLHAPSIMQNGDADVIALITQTMIGDWLWKYTRKAVGQGLSERRHKRFFWIHPYTRTLYWSTQAPGTDSFAESKAKSAAIESVVSVQDTNPAPQPNMALPQTSLLIQTRGRQIKLTAPDASVHDAWYESLSYLLARQQREDKREAVDSSVSSIFKKPSLQRLRPTPSHSSILPSRSCSRLSHLDSDEEDEALEDVRMCCNGKHHVSKLEKRKV